MADDKKIEEKKELTEEDTKKVSGSYLGMNHYWCPDCRKYSLSRRCNQCGRQL